MERKLEMLKQVPLFSGLNEEGLREVGRLADEVNVPAGASLTKQGAFAHEFFLILEGSVSIDRNGMIVNHLGPGDFLGEIALVDGGTRSATAVTESPARLMVLGHREFNTLVDEFPEVRDGVFQALASRVRRLEPEGSH